jgi:hypothetical protein
VLPYANSPRQRRSNCHAGSCFAARRACSALGTPEQPPRALYIHLTTSFMKNLKLLTAMAAFSSILFFGCDKETDGPASPINPILDKVEPSDCDVLTPVNLWLGRQFAGWSPEAKKILTDEEVAKMAIFLSVFSENSSANQYYGVNGEYTAQLTNGFTDLKRFWDTKSDDIILVAAHSSALQDRNKIFIMYKAEYGYSDVKATYYADSITTLLKTYPEYLDGNHPFFTFNGYAHQEKTYPSVGLIQDKIIFGDALLQGFDAIGYGDIAPQAILAHEFAHHIQYNLGIKDYSIPLTPERSRRTELMADAYAAYFLTHARGAALPMQSVQRAGEVFSNLGDCQFEMKEHHGTPTQRKAATEWGYKLAADTRNQDSILPSREFARLFDTELNNIVKN